MREEEIDGFRYRAGKLDARKQWNLIRRLAPVLTALGPALQSMAKNMPQEGATTDLAEDVNMMFSAFGPLAEALGNLDDATSDYVINVCLTVVHTNRTGSSWAAVSTSNGQLMFQDITMMTMIRLVILVLRENFENFLGELPGLSNVGQGALVANQ